MNSHIYQDATLRLYMFLKKHAHEGRVFIPVDNFLEYMKVPGERKSETYGHFKRSVVKPAIDRINNWSDLKVSMFEIKESRTIMDLHFYIKEDKYFPIP